MTTERYNRGWEKLMEVDGTGGAKVIESLKDISPDLGQFVIEFAFGDIYTRDELDLRQRQLITISSLTTLGGCEPQLNVHINAALNVGLSPKQIVEAILHCAPYAGFPRVLNATFVAKDVFKSRGITLQDQQKDSSN
ncbi:Carboxymuconolactone decarboxylase family protein [compost metagenome]